MVQTRTRTGRQIKKPELYTPEETVLEDDYTIEEHDSDLGSDIDTEDEMSPMTIVKKMTMMREVSKILS